LREESILLIFLSVSISLLLSISNYQFDAYALERRSDLSVELFATQNQISQTASSSKGNLIEFTIYVLNPPNARHLDYNINCEGKPGDMQIPDVFPVQVINWYWGHTDFGNKPMTMLQAQFPVGNRYVTCTVGFRESNPYPITSILHEGKLEFPVFIEDKTPPTINGQETLIQWSVNNPAKVSYTYQFSAVDNIDGKVELSCNPPSDSLFPVGFTNVVCTAKDAAGNVNTRNFKVEVRSLDKGTGTSGNDDNNQGTSSPQKPTDGRPQPEKNGNNDASTWKVVHMRNDPSLYKVVDDENINIADRFHSEESAQQYVDYYKWKQSQD
jgi:hypothetical protein